MDETTILSLYLSTLVFVIGACIGSFLNVVIYRLPAGESVVTPRSHCRCGKPIAWYDNIPILSWFILRGEMPPLRGTVQHTLSAGGGGYGPAVSWTVECRGLANGRGLDRVRGDDDPGSDD